MNGNHILRRLVEAVDADIFTDAHECAGSVEAVHGLIGEARAYLQAQPTTKLRVTLWIAAADADGGTQAAAFKTEAEAEDWVLEQLESEFNSREAFEAACTADPETDFWEYVDAHKCDPHLDTFNIEPQDFEFEVPMLASPAMPVRVMVGVKGGMVQGYSANCPVEVCVIDYDTDGAELEDRIDVPQTDGGTAEGTGHVGSADVDPVFVDRVFAAVRAHWGEEHNPAQAPADDLEAAVAVAEASFAPQPGEVAESGDEIDEANVAHLVSDGLVLLDAIGWSVVPAPGQVRFLTVPVEGDEGTIWSATIRKES